MQCFSDGVNSTGFGRDGSNPQKTLFASADGSDAFDEHRSCGWRVWCAEIGAGVCPLVLLLYGGYKASPIVLQDTCGIACLPLLG